MLTGQLMHSVSPGSDWYLPAGHSTQVSVADLTVKYLPARQAVQLSTALEPMAGPQYLMLQVQDVLVPLATADAEFTPQVKQADNAVLAVSSL